MNTSSPPNLITPFKPSERVSFQKLTKISTAINRMNAGVLSPRQVLSALQNSGVTTSIPIVITSILQNMIVGNPYDVVTGAAGTITVYVAKPPILRATNVGPRNVVGQTYTISYSDYSTDGQSRTATRSSDSTTETQGVDDAYQAGDVIQAEFSPTGLLNPDGNAVNLLDLNIDARHWAQVATT